MPDVKVEAIFDPDIMKRRAAATLFNGDVKTHGRFDALLHDKIDGIVVASPPAHHVEQAVAALNADKAVFLEKPPAMTQSDLDRLLGAARGRFLACDYVYAYNPLIRFAKEQMGDDFELITVRCEWTNWGIVRTDVDAWWSVAPHPMSVLVFLFNQKIEVLHRHRGDGFADAHLKIGDGFGSFFVSWLDPMKVREIRIVGTKRTVIVDDVQRKVWLIKHDDVDGGIRQPNVKYKPKPLDAALAEFVKCAKTGKESVTGPDMIRRVTELML